MAKTKKKWRYLFDISEFVKQIQTTLEDIFFVAFINTDKSFIGMN